MSSAADTIRRAEAEPRSVDPEELAFALREHARGAAQALTSTVSMKGVGNQPDWSAAETEIWRVGEAVRAYLRARRDCRGRGPLADALEELACNGALGKGRGNLVNLLGTYGGDTYTDAMVDMVQDREVAAAVVQELLRRKDGRFVVQVRAAVDTTADHPAFHRYARRYLKLYSVDAI